MSGDEFSSRLLVDLARGAGDSAWRELDSRYRGALLHFAERLGLSPIDADEVAQDALSAFASACRAREVEPQRATLSRWLFAFVRDRVRQRWRWLAVRAGERGDSALGSLADDERLSTLWDDEWRAALLREGLRRVREEEGFSAATLEAFTSVALEGREAADVGRALGLTPNAVHQAKFRVMERLREILSALQRADHIEPRRNDRG